MYDEHQDHASYQERPHESSADYDGQQRGSYRPRQDYSRSPDRQYQQHRERGSRDQSEDRYRHQRDVPYRDERDRAFRGGDYSGMYDEPADGDASHRGDYRGDGRRHHGRRSRSRPRHERRSRSRTPTKDAGEPNDTIILEGLPYGVTTDELRESLLYNSVAADFPAIDVRIQSSKGQRRAFVQFSDMSHSIAFVKEHYPKILIELQQPTDEVPDAKFEVYLHYARRREEWDAKPSSTSNWNCASCDFSNYSTRTKCKVCGGPQTAPNWQQSLTGATDAADVPSQILVIYPLPSFVDEEKLATDIIRLEKVQPDPAKANAEGAPKLKSTAPGGDVSSQGAREGSIHRIFLMRDVDTDESFKYGFVEFWTLADAAAAMSKFQMAKNFTIAGCAVTISTIHMGVFLPEDRNYSPEIERFSFNPLFNPALRVRYRDLHVYPSQRVVHQQPPADGNKRATPEEIAEQQKARKRKADGSLGAASAKKAAVPMGGQMALWQKKHDELHEGGVQNASPPKSDANAPIKISLTNSTIGRAQPGSGAGPVSGPQTPSEAETGNAQELYTDHDRLMCLICMRKYKSLEEVSIHEKSRNHKTAMENDELVKAALPRLATRDKRLKKQPAPTADDGAPSEDQNDSQYRDRAKERRQAFNQPGKPNPNNNKSTTSNSHKPKSEAKQTEEPKAPAASKGAGMLAKMGWTTGAGLGANGEGRTEVVATNAYQEGVGLGAEGSNLGDAAVLAERKTKGSYTDYVNTVQDKARERYNKLE